MSHNGADLKTVDIRPGVSMLSVLRHLNYKPWFALAEFVDNSLQSYLSNAERLKKVDGDNFKLLVEIELDYTDGHRIIVRDNAAGISAKDYARAFRPAAVPLDRKGLCEFGMGMKSAACWFSPRWHVRTKALGEDVAREIRFDIEKIVGNDVEVLKVQARPTPKNTHYTEIVLDSLHQPPQSKTLGKIREYLTDIYRVFLRSGVLELKLDGESLKYQEPAILEAASYKHPNGPKHVWKKEIKFDFGDGMRVSGFAAIRETASTSKAGFALFRRNRLIQGAGEEGYRPEYIFGRPNSFRYQRVFGELHLEGFDVSHTKDGFRWDENEQPFLELLDDHLNKGELQLLQQADRVRVRERSSGFKAAAKTAAKNTAAAVEAAVTNVLPNLASHPNEGVEVPSSLPKARLVAKEEVREVEFRGQKWTIQLELTDDAGISDWLTIMDSQTDSMKRHVALRLALEHPFMERFSGSTVEEIEPLLRVAVALGLAEIVARDTGVKKAGSVRRAVNELLRESLASP